METTDIRLTLIDNKARSRYEVAVEGQVAFAEYRREGDKLYIPYVESPPLLRGTGVAGRLMEEVMKEARRQKLKVIPICGYAAAWIRRHSQYEDLLAAP